MVENNVDKNANYTIKSMVYVGYGALKPGKCELTCPRLDMHKGAAAPGGHGRGVVSGTFSSTISYDSEGVHQTPGGAGGSGAMAGLEAGSAAPSAAARHSPLHAGDSTVRATRRPATPPGAPDRAPSGLAPASGDGTTHGAIAAGTAAAAASPQRMPHDGAVRDHSVSHEKVSIRGTAVPVYDMGEHVAAAIGYSMLFPASAVLPSGSHPIALAAMAGEDVAEDPGDRAKSTRLRSLKRSGVRLDDGKRAVRLLGEDTPREAAAVTNAVDALAASRPPVGVGYAMDPAAVSERAAFVAAARAPPGVAAAAEAAVEAAMDDGEAPPDVTRAGVAAFAAGRTDAAGRDRSQLTEFLNDPLAFQHTMKPLESGTVGLGAAPGSSGWVDRELSHKAVIGSVRPSALFVRSRVLPDGAPPLMEGCVCHKACTSSHDVCACAFKNWSRNSGECTSGGAFGHRGADAVLLSVPAGPSSSGILRGPWGRDRHPSRVRVQSAVLLLAPVHEQGAAARRDGLARGVRDWGPRLRCSDARGDSSRGVRR